MRKKVVVLFCSFCAIIGLLLARVGVLCTSDTLAQAAQKQTSYTLELGSVRGQIYDYKFRPLVNRASTAKAAVLPAPENFDAVLRSVSSERKSAVLDLLQKGNPFTLTVEHPDLLRNVEGVTVVDTPDRYADDQLAVHVIGHLDSTRHGATGIEKAYDSLLAGTDSRTTVTYHLDGLGKALKGSPPTITNAEAPASGVVLTIDSEIQQIVEQAGAKYLKKGAVVVAEAKTGKLRAVASFPNFSPNDMAQSVKDTVNTPMINRAFSAYNVGSTFKVSTAAAALESGISKNLTYTCTGEIDVKGQKFKCHELDGHGTLNMASSMNESCNPYYINLAAKVPTAGLRSMAADLSFGRSFDLAPGIRTAAAYLPTMADLYNPADVANFSFGQGKLTATPLQITMMMCSVVNGGKTPSPTLVEGTTADGTTVSAAGDAMPFTYAMSGKTASIIKEFMVSDVMQKSGQYAKPRTISAGGKTGTAQTGQFEGTREILQAWFSGFFPADNPKYVVTVLCEDGDYGNTSAGPVFRDIADKVWKQELYWQKQKAGQ